MNKTNNLYTIHNPHTDVSRRDWSKHQYIRAVSIDPGKTNFCIRIEDRPLNKPGPIRPLVYERLSLAKSTVPNEEQLYTSLSNQLRTWIDLLIPAHLVIIERQLPDNYLLVRISQHLLTWFLEYLRDGPNLAVIIEVSGKLKVQAYGQTNLNKTALKAWAGQAVMDLFQRRADTQSLAIITKSRKKDDLADVILQLEAICELLGWYSDK